MCLVFLMVLSGIFRICLFRTQNESMDLIAGIISKSLLKENGLTNVSDYHIMWGLLLLVTINRIWKHICY